MKKLQRFIKLTAPIVFVLIGGSWLPDGIKEGGLAGLYWAISGFMLFIAGSYWVYIQRREYFFVHISEKKEVRKRKVLIMPISTINDLEKLRKSDDGCYVFGDVNLKTSIPEFQKQSLKGLSWQQTVRGIAMHLGAIERLYLIGSVGDSGSYHQLKQCKEFIEYYLSGIDIAVWEESVNFENLEDVLNELDKVIKHAREKYLLSDIMLDVTAGPKVTSIAGALVTLNYRELEFQYVSTTEPNQVIAFNTNAEKSEIS